MPLTYKVSIRNKEGRGSVQKFVGKKILVDKFVAWAESAGYTPEIQTSGVDDGEVTVHGDFNVSSN